MRNIITINRNFLLIVLSLFLLAAGLVGCMDDVPTTPPIVDPTSEPETGPTTPQNNTWEMTAVLVNSNGEVLETTELTASVMIWEQEGRDYYSLRFKYPEDIYNTGSGVMPYPDDESLYTCCSGFRTESGGQGDVTGSYYVGFDAEKECFIVDFDDAKDVYLIAYRSQDADISALWAHFQDFIEMIPDTFPEIMD